jgi:predicted AAA+ superfamily ATPase
VLVFDEIQAIPRALTALKYFNQEIPELAVCVAGSNLGIAMAAEPFPVGKVDIIEMFPLSFKEYLQGTGDLLALEFIEEFSGGKTNDLIHKR